ncbi:MAG: Fe-S cluster assembly protein SufD [Alphaproteobacteria bacterium]
MNLNLTAKQPFLDDYEASFPNMVGAKHNWLSAIRKNGLQAYSNHGINLEKIENWHYTKLKFLKTINFVKSNVKSKIKLPEITDVNASYVAVVVNGKFRDDLSFGDVPKGIKIFSLASVLENDTPDWISEILAKQVDMQNASLAALNTAWLEDGYVIDVMPNVSLKKPILILMLNDAGKEPSAIYTRGLVRLGKNAHIKIIEEHSPVVEKICFVNAVTELVLSEDAKLGYYKRVKGSSEAYHIGFVGAMVLKNAELESFIMQNNAALSRSEYNVNLAGEGAKAVVNGAYMGAEHQISDITCCIEHNASYTCSDQIIRGLVAGDSKAVFQGKIFVNRGTAKVDGNQNHKALLLSKNAEVDCKPELEIYADDVKCSHGATTGFLDKDAMFYLRARGVSENDAQKMLAAAFLKDAISTIKDDNIIDYFEKNLEKWLDNNLL